MLALGACSPGSFPRVLPATGRQARAGVMYYSVQSEPYARPIRLIKRPNSFGGTLTASSRDGFYCQPSRPSAEQERRAD